MIFITSFFLHILYYYYLCRLGKNFTLWLTLNNPQIILLFAAFVFYASFLTSYSTNFFESLSTIFLVTSITLFTLWPSYDTKPRNKNLLTSFLVKNDSNIITCATIITTILNYNTENSALMGLCFSILIFELNWRRYFPKHKSCDKNTTGCSINYLIRDDDKNLPNCCYEHLNDMFKDFVIFLNDNNIQYWLDGGTLIGQYRENKLIEWDDDIDIAFTLNRNWKDLSILIRKFCKEHEYYVEEYRDLKRFAIFYHGYNFKPFNSQVHRIKNHLKIDFVCYDLKDDHYVRSITKSQQKDNLKIHSSQVYPLQIVDMLDLKVKIPNDPLHYLDNFNYGDITVQIKTDLFSRP